MVNFLPMHICEKDEMFLNTYMEMSFECKEDALVQSLAKFSKV
jgi:hypothetical protein